jgi:hypothetical protein
MPSSPHIAGYLGRRSRGSVKNVPSTGRSPASRRTALLVRVERCRQWLTEQVPAINAMSAHGNVLFACTTASRLPAHHTGWIDESSSWQHIHHAGGSPE